MPPKSDLVYLQHMLDYARIASEIGEGKTVDGLQGDLPAQLALIRALQTIGEAANNTTEELRSRHPEVPWRRMIDMRNFLVHAYWDIDLSIVLTTATEKVPELIRQIESMITIEQRKEET